MSRESDLEIGARVVCIDDRFNSAAYEWFNELPRKGQVYTISASFIGTQHGTNKKIRSYRLVEIPPIHPNRAGFSYWRFRALTKSHATADTRQMALTSSLLPLCPDHHQPVIQASSLCCPTGILPVPVPVPVLIPPKTNHQPTATSSTSPIIHKG